MADRQRSTSTLMTKLRLAALAFDSALAVRNSWGDAASVAFVLATDAALALLLLRKFDRARAQYSALATVAVAALLCTTALETYGARRDAAAAAVMFLSYAVLLALTGVFLAGFFDRRSQARGERDQPKATQMDSSALTKVGLGALAFNSALAVYNSWGDAASVAFVLAADAALALLFLRLQLRQFERAGGGRGEENGWGRINNNRGAALATLAVAVQLCTTALDTYSARRDAVSAAVVFMSYAVFLAMTGVFLAGFARARHGGQQGRAGEGLAIVEEELKAMFASGVAALVPPAVAAAVWAVAVATVPGGFWAFFAPKYVANA